MKILLFVAFTFICFALSPRMQAVNPPPDGGYAAYTVRYDAVNAMLLNEFLKEHRKNEEQQATIERQQKQIDALTIQLTEQASQIQKVERTA
jgi:hypothetical protein